MRRIVSLLLLFLCLLFTLPAAAWQKGAQLAPLRLIMEGRDRAATLRVINPHKTPTAYRIEPILLRQDATGRLMDVAPAAFTETERRTLKMIRLSPRQVRLAPGAMQAIRIMARKPADLPSGEYRCHIRVSPIADPKANADQGKGIQLNLLVGTSVPLIIRHGETTARLAATPFSPATLPDGRNALKTRLSLTGNRSLYLGATLFSGKKEIGSLTGFAVYLPNASREVVIPVHGPMPTEGSRVHLVLRDREIPQHPIVKEWILPVSQSPQSHGPLSTH